MRGYMLALAASIGVFMAGLSLGYLCIHLLSMSPKALIMAVMRTPSAQATVTRAEAVSQAVQAVAESMEKAVTTQPGRSIIHEWLVGYISTALGIFSTNMLTALGAALTPLLPVLWPMRIHAIYERQYRVEAAGEYGVSGSGWYPENSTAVIRAPATPQAALLIKRVFRGWAGDLDSVLDNRGDTLVLKVVRPVRIMAVYATEPDYISSIIVAGIITALAALGLRGIERRRKPREAASGEAEEVRVISA